MGRQKLIAGNWKMNLSLSAASSLAEEVEKQSGRIPEVELVVCPTFLQLDPVKKKLDRVGLGAQDVFWERGEGAFTGEISVEMLAEIGVKYVLIGHSERRHVIGERNEIVSKKLKVVLEAGLRPVLCVGETLDERERGKTEEIVGYQVDRGLGEMDKVVGQDLVIAYEPVWAIGTGRNATGEEAEKVVEVIRERLRQRIGREEKKTRVIYGGSIKPENISEFSRPGIDGALVGGASLEAKTFLEIAKNF